MLVILKSWGGGWDGILSSLVSIASDVKCDVTDHVDIKASKIGSVVMMNFGEFDNSEIITYLIMK